MSDLHLTDDIHPRLRRAVLDALGANPSVTRRRIILTALDDLRAEQQQLLDAQRRDKTRRLADRREQNDVALRGRKPASFVRIERDGERLRIFIGRQLFYDLNRPERLDVERMGGVLRLVTTVAPAGYGVIVPDTSMPRIQCDAARDIVDLDSGRYAAEVRGTTLVIGDAL